MAPSSERPDETPSKSVEQEQTVEGNDGESSEPSAINGENDPPLKEPDDAEERPRVPVELDDADIDLLLEVWDIIDQEFDGRLPDQEEVTYSAIAGSLELLEDDYTRFITPEVAARIREQLNGSFEGIGAFVDMDEDGYLIIVRPIEDQPADRAGLMANDLVTHVNGKSVLGMSLEEITAEIKGPEGTEVTLTIRRDSSDEPFEVTVERAKIEIPIVSAEMLDDNVAYVRLTGFSANAAQQLEDELENLLAQSPRGLILDLRDNPGGFLSQSVAVADLFLGDGVVLYERDGRELEEVFESEDGDLAEEIELVVLVNAGSASASEIVAGAIQDRDRGILVGEATFGKGSVQQPHTLSDGSELRVTIARWYTPDNQSIDADGIAPDIEVASPEEFGTEADTQLQRAIRHFLAGS
jgi:carboxyl-terminal processing protease